MAKNKTEIHVTTVFDGELDATDVFVSLISHDTIDEQTFQPFNDCVDDKVHTSAPFLEKGTTGDT